MDHKQVKADFRDWAETHEVESEISHRLTHAVRWVAWLGFQAAAKKYAGDYGKRKDAQGQKKLEFEKET